MVPFREGLLREGKSGLPRDEWHSTRSPLARNAPRKKTAANALTYADLTFSSMQPREETAMSIASELLPCATAIALAMLALSPTSNALAQTATQRSSALPSGGGAALFDASDAVILLLDHLSGLFQTVKDISVAELRSNTINARETRDAPENSCHNDCLRAQRTAYAGNSSSHEVIAASPNSGVNTITGEGMFNRRCFVIGANQTGAGFCQGDA